MKTRTSTLLAIIAIPVVILIGFLSPNGMPAKTSKYDFGWAGYNHGGYYKIAYGEKAELNNYQFILAGADNYMETTIEYPNGKIFIVTVSSCYRGKCIQADEYAIAGVNSTSYKIAKSTNGKMLMGQLTGPDGKEYLLFKKISELSDIWKGNDLFDKKGNFRKKFKEEIPKIWDIILVDGKRVVMQ